MSSFSSNAILAKARSMYSHRLTEQNYEKNIKPLAIEKLKNKLGSDIKILSLKVLKKEENTDRIDIEIFFKVEEDITSYKSLKDFNIEEENKKLEKESR